MEDRKAERAAEEQRNAALGQAGSDVDFTRMIREYRAAHAHTEREHAPPGASNIIICVRKRPISAREVAKMDHDAVTCYNPRAIVHDCKHRVDGITKYLSNQEFVFDHVFGPDEETSDVYECVARPLVDFVARGGRATVFAYGQTGSGKTFTMEGVERSAARDLFAALPRGACVDVSFFEIYGGRCQDLLHGRRRLQVREDGNGEVQIADLEEVPVATAEEIMQLIDEGNSLRTTQKTEANDTSSSSHAICQIVLRARAAARAAGTGKVLGKMSLVDLAGSERGTDTKQHNRQLRTESAEINKSLLALKECIRGMANGSSHVPFRASKLTMVGRARRASWCAQLGDEAEAPFSLSLRCCATRSCGPTAASR